MIDNDQFTSRMNRRLAIGVIETKITEAAETLQDLVVAVDHRARRAAFYNGNWHAPSY